MNRIKKPGFLKKLDGEKDRCRLLQVVEDESLSIYDDTGEIQVDVLEVRNNNSDVGDGDVLGTLNESVSSAQSPSGKKKRTMFGKDSKVMSLFSGKQGKGANSQADLEKSRIGELSNKPTSLPGTTNQTDDQLDNYDTTMDLSERRCHKRRASVTHISGTDHSAFAQIILDESNESIQVDDAICKDPQSRLHSSCQEFNFRSGSQTTGGRASKMQKEVLAMLGLSPGGDASQPTLTRNTSRRKLISRTVSDKNIFTSRRGFEESNPSSPRELTLTQARRSRPGISRTSSECMLQSDRSLRVGDLSPNNAAPASNDNERMHSRPRSRVRERRQQPRKDRRNETDKTRNGHNASPKRHQRGKSRARRDKTTPRMRQRADQEDGQVRQKTGRRHGHESRELTNADRKRHGTKSSQSNEGYKTRRRASLSAGAASQQHESFSEMRNEENERSKTASSDSRKSRQSQNQSSERIVRSSSRAPRAKDERPRFTGRNLPAPMNSFRRKRIRPEDCRAREEVVSWQRTPSFIQERPILESPPDSRNSKSDQGGDSEPQRSHQARAMTPSLHGHDKAISPTGTQSNGTHKPNYASSRSGDLYDGLRNSPSTSSMSEDQSKHSRCFRSVLAEIPFMTIAGEKSVFDLNFEPDSNDEESPEDPDFQYSRVAEEFSRLNMELADSDFLLNEARLQVKRLEEKNTRLKEQIDSLKSEHPTLQDITDSHSRASRHSRR